MDKSQVDLAVLKFGRDYDQEELKQECYISLWKAGEPTDPKLIFTIAKRTVIRIVTREKQTESLSEPEVLAAAEKPAESGLDSRIDGAKAVHFLDNLLPEESEVLKSLYGISEQKTYRQLAADYKKSVGWVRLRERDGLRKLRGIMKVKNGD